MSGFDLSGSGMFNNLNSNKNAELYYDFSGDTIVVVNGSTQGRYKTPGCYVRINSIPYTDYTFTVFGTNGETNVGRPFLWAANSLEDLSDRTANLQTINSISFNSGNSSTLSVGVLIDSAAPGDTFRVSKMVLSAKDAAKSIKYVTDADDIINPLLPDPEDYNGSITLSISHMNSNILLYGSDVASYSPNGGYAVFIPEATNENIDIGTFVNIRMETTNLYGNNYINTPWFYVFETSSDFYSTFNNSGIYSYSNKGEDGVKLVVVTDKYTGTKQWKCFGGQMND